MKSLLLFLIGHYLPARTTEAIAVGIDFAKATGCTIKTSVLSFGFRWTKLSGRELAAWVSPRLNLSLHGRAYDDVVIAYVECSTRYAFISSWRVCAPSS